MEKLPVVFVVPERRPVDVLKLRPAGSEPVNDHVGEPTAPLCVNWAEKGEPAVPAVVSGFVTAMFWQLIVRLYVAPVPVQPLTSVATTTIEKLVCCMVVPCSVPLGSSVKPLGSVLAVENVVAPWPPVCVNCWLNGVPTVPV